MNVTVILGSNMGNRISLINNAIKLMSQNVGELVSQSSNYETEPWGFESSSIFINRIAIFKSTLSPEDFLQQCLSIEKQLGRTRHESETYESRTMDIDILFYGDKIIHTKSLIVPHPRISERRFVLEPLHELLPNYIHPEFHKSISELLTNCPDNSAVKMS